MHKHKPWLKFYEGVPESIDYPEKTMYEAVMDKTCLELLILTKIPDYLPLLKGIGFALTKGRKIPKVPPDSRVRWWKDLMKVSVPAFKKQLVAHCRKDLIKWSCPRNIEFRDKLPLTLIGKVAYRVLEDEEIAKLKKTGQYAGE